ncbi:DUF3052 domain-containing protein [Streptomyces sp. NPDC018833]|uniref:DUF3052 domain-containing protein n=1 Tax=Streptomyces sp. NPDC018833 TaxID=3365053 RepID=UPI00378FBC08
MSAAGYAGTPLAGKIGIRAGDRVVLRHRPDDWEVPGLPEGASLTERASRTADVTLTFHRTRRELAREAPGLVERLADRAMLWVVWPRKAAGHDSDITENVLREVFLPLGVVDVKVAALGEDWSALKFVRRAENRAD